MADPIRPDPRFLQMSPAANNNKVLFQLLYPLAGDRVLVKHRTPGGLLDLFSPDKGTENSNTNISKNSLTTTTSFVSRKYMERTSFFKLSRCWLRDFESLVPLPDNENAGGSAICVDRDLLPEEAIATHVVTCQGRDHLVNIRSGRHNLVIVNVHFEPEHTLRQLRGR